MDRLDRERLERLIEAGRGLMADLDLELVLDRLLETARELTGARYAALGILDEDRRELEQFLTRGIDDETHRAIGDLPRGRGILGVLIADPRPLRLDDVGHHPRSYGFPVHHPPMTTFLGVPVRIRGESWGNLYLTEKEGGVPFTDEDEASVTVLADWAGIAIEHARLYEAADARRDELERAVRGLEATVAIARAVGGETDVARILELIVKRGRALVDARAVVILRGEDELTLAAAAGDVVPQTGEAPPVRSPQCLAALEQRRTVRVEDVERELGLLPEQVGVPDASHGLVVPLVYRARAFGLLMAFDRLSGSGAFSAEDQELLQAVAASAATAVANAQTVEAERLGHSLRAAEEERRRWARELHDETLQALAALRMTLRAAARSDDPDRMHEALDEAAEQVSRDIANLRAIITELRPASLDELGLTPALETLLEGVATKHGLELRSTVDLPEHRLAPEHETVVYRLVQEALTNVTKHARASAVSVEIGHADGRIVATIADDGVGFDPDRPAEGFGLAGMRERVALAGGELEVRSDGEGTVVRAVLPIAYADEGSVTSPRSIA